MRECVAPVRERRSGEHKYIFYKTPGGFARIFFPKSKKKKKKKKSFIVSMFQKFRVVKLNECHFLLKKDRPYLRREVTVIFFRVQQEKWHLFFHLSHDCAYVRFLFYWWVSFCSLKNLRRTAILFGCLVLQHQTTTLLFV